MKTRQRLVSIIVILVAVACGRADGPLSGNVRGASFFITGARSARVDSYTVLTLVNTPASCTSPEATANGLIRVDMSVPTDTLAPGTFPINDKVKVGVTSLAQTNGEPSFTGVALSSGTVTLDRVAPQVEGALSGSGSGVSLSGRFAVPLCP